MSCEKCGAPIKYADCGPGTPARYDDSMVTVLETEVRLQESSIRIMSINWKKDRETAEKLIVEASGKDREIERLESSLREIKELCTNCNTIDDAQRLACLVLDGEEGNIAHEQLCEYEEAKKTIEQLENKLNMWYELNDMPDVPEIIKRLENEKEELHSDIHLLKHYIRQETKAVDSDFKIIPMTHINHPDNGTSYALIEMNKKEIRVPPMDIHKTRRGDFVKFYTIKAGLDGQKDDIQKRLTLGRCYEVEFLDVHSCHTNVYLIGHDKPFNSVFFKNV